MQDPQSKVNALEKIILKYLDCKINGFTEKKNLISTSPKKS